MLELIILAVFVVSIAAMFWIVYFLPSILIKWRASTLGLKLTYSQAKTVAKSYCNKKDFLVDVKDIWLWADVPIDKLTTHFHAKGSLKNLKAGIIEMIQKNREVDFSALATLDLAGRDLKDEVKKAEKRNWVFDLATD